MTTAAKKKFTFPNGRRAAEFIAKLFMYALLLELVYVIIFPFITRISASFMSLDDSFDRTVNLVPRHPTFMNYVTVLTESNYLSAVTGTATLAIFAAVTQTFVCAMTGYALSKLRGKLATVVMGIVLLSVLVPPQVVLVPLYLNFRFFDVFGIVKFLTGNTLNLMDSITPIAILSLTGFGFKNGLYIFIMRQFFKGVPEEIEEAALIDGSGAFRAYLRVILPVSTPMLITIFMLAFSWQWTDTFYTGIFFNKFQVIARTIFTMKSAAGGSFANAWYSNMLLHTGVLLAILPIILIYSVAQKWLVTGLERSGIVG